MKKVFNQNRQRLLLSALAAIFVLGASVSTFASERKSTDNSVFDYISMNADHNLLFNTSAESDFAKIQLNNLSPANFKFATGDYPAPDFSEMEKWYEITKYEYGDIAAGDWKFYYWVKPKTDTRPTSFHVDYTDKEGVNSTPWATGCDIPYDGLTHVGKTYKCYASTPPEKDLDNMVSAKIIRNKY